MQSGSGWRGRAASSACPPGEARGGGADDTGLRSCVSPPQFHLPSISLSRVHPHTHTILALLIQGKERLMLSWTGHHKLFFLSSRKKHLPPTVTSSPPSSLLSSFLMQSHGLCNTEDTKDRYKAVPWGHRGAQGCTRFPHSDPTPQEAEEPRVIKGMRAITTTGSCQSEVCHLLSFILHLHHSAEEN